MPTYDYACSACGHRFEEFQSMSSDPLKKCPACKKSKLERLIGTGAGVIFKGSGFYETDYRGESYKQDAKKDSEQGSSSAKGTSDAGSSDTGSSDTGSSSSSSSNKGSSSKGKSSGGGASDASAAGKRPK
jgi:putative FmdB family regulatory protein